MRKTKIKKTYLYNRKEIEGAIDEILDNVEAIHVLDSSPHVMEDELASIKQMLIALRTDLKELA